MKNPYWMERAGREIEAANCDGMHLNPEETANIIHEEYSKSEEAAQLAGVVECLKLAQVTVFHAEGRSPFYCRILKALEKY